MSYTKCWNCDSEHRVCVYVCLLSAHPRERWPEHLGNLGLILALVGSYKESLFFCCFLMTQI